MLITTVQTPPVLRFIAHTAVGTSKGKYDWDKTLGGGGGGATYLLGYAKEHVYQ